MKELFKGTPIPKIQAHIKDEIKDDIYMRERENRRMYLIREELLLKWLNNLPKKNKIKFDYSIKKY